MPRSERALILLKPQFLGDAVMACPLIDGLAQAYDRPIVLCGPLVKELLADRSDEVQFEQGSKLSGIRPVFETAKRLKGMGVQHAYLVNRSFRSALAVKLAGIPVRIGHATEGRGFLLTHTVPYDEVKFEADCYLDLARRMDVPVTDSKSTLSLLPGEREAGQEALQGASVGIQPGARYPNKQVPLPVMAEVCNAFSRKGEHIVLLGGKDEEGFVPQFQSMLDAPAHDLVGKLDIRQTMGALANLRLMLGSDTGLMHVAAAVGAPTLTVFGPNPASKWGHNYEPHRVIEAPGGDIRKVTAEQILSKAF